MKKIWRMLIWVLLVAAFTSCEKEPIVVTPNKPTIKVSANVTEIAYGDSSILTIIVTNADTVGSELGVVPVITNTFQVSTPKLNKTTTYHFTAYGQQGLVDIANIEIKVKALPVAPTVKITAVPTTVLLGNSAVIQISKTGDITKTLVNGRIIEGNSFTTEPLTEDTKFVVEVFGINQEPIKTASNYAIDSVVVKVDLPLSYLAQNHFYIILKEVKGSDGEWYEIYGECTSTDTTYFRANYTLEIYRVCNPANPYYLVGVGTWYFNENQTKINMGGWLDIIELNDKNFKIINEAGDIRVTYGRKKN